MYRTFQSKTDMATRVILPNLGHIWPATFVGVPSLITWNWVAERQGGILSGALTCQNGFLTTRTLSNMHYFISDLSQSWAVWHWYILLNKQNVQLVSELLNRSNFSNCTRAREPKQMKKMCILVFFIRCCHSRVAVWKFGNVFAKDNIIIVLVTKNRTAVHFWTKVIQHLKVYEVST